MESRYEVTNSITAAVLCGGLGTRLKSVIGANQKTLASVAGVPFLKFPIVQLCNSGVRDIVLCAGFQADQMAAAINTITNSAPDDLNIECSIETEPLGTGGALRLALPYLHSSTIIVLNGDSFCDLDLNLALQQHHLNKALITMVVIEHADNARYGQVLLDDNNRVVSFLEKHNSNGLSGLINAGVYLIERNLVAEIPANTAISLENDLFPKWIAEQFHAYRTSGRFIDIGVPADYLRAQDLFVAE